MRNQEVPNVLSMGILYVPTFMVLLHTYMSILKDMLCLHYFNFILILFFAFENVALSKAEIFAELLHPIHTKDNYTVLC